MNLGEGRGAVSLMVAREVPMAVVAAVEEDSEVST